MLQGLKMWYSTTILGRDDVPWEQLSSKLLRHSRKAAEATSHWPNLVPIFIWLSRFCPVRFVASANTMLDIMVCCH